MAPGSFVPASVTPRCSGASECSRNLLLASTISGTWLAFSDTLKSKKSISSAISTLCKALDTSASAFGSSQNRFSTDPELNPLRMAVRGTVRHPVIEMDVGEQGYRRTPHGLPETFEGFGSVDGDSHEVGAGGVEVVYLLHRRLDVVGHGIRHRLHGHLGAAANGHIADLYLPARNRAFAQCCLCHLTPIRLGRPYLNPG